MGFCLLTVAAQYLNDQVIAIESSEAQLCQARVSFQISASTLYQRRNGSLLEETEASVGQKNAIPTGLARLKVPEGFGRTHVLPSLHR
ncbi:hypothetical protein RU07_23940 [Agrobacterium tumefaciens]|uniref:Uncharacterized protein n=1 Tax=Agrobacterium tumefaciens TaxID=358 RepID=A0A0D0KHX4_AGRTU|nr:hypothetical protein RU07_23940 [Agrobacterium tumefaciens]